jgi:hypothetical protein
MPQATRAITHRLLLVLVAAALPAGAATSCAGVNLSQALQVTDVSTGYYDSGIVEGKDKFVPAIQFALHNVSGQSLANVPVMVSFWKTAANDEWDSTQVHGIGPDGLAPGATSAPLVVRLGVGYTLEQPQPSSQLFTHAEFVEIEAKVFAQRSGQWYSLGTFPVAHNILPHVSGASAGTSGR